MKVTFWQRFNMKRQNRKLTQTVSLRSLFRYATFVDFLYMLLAIIASVISGAIDPLSLVIFGNSINTFIDRVTNLCSLNFTSLTQEYCPPGVMLTSNNFYTSTSLCNFTGSNLTEINFDLKDQTNNQIIFFIIIGCVLIICGYIRVAAFNITAERQTRTIRQILFQSILKKDIVYFDTHKTGELNTLLSDDVNKIRDGIGDKLGAIIRAISTFISCVIISRLFLSEHSLEEKFLII
ncbi:unnamed protein product [Rotaria sp. Silwood1]|nr:unnamed protein product [Rotaria sp. Silwood1]